MIWLRMVTDSFTTCLFQPSRDQVPQLSDTGVIPGVIKSYTKLLPLSPWRNRSDRDRLPSTCSAAPPP